MGNMLSRVLRRLRAEEEGQPRLRLVGVQAERYQTEGGWRHVIRQVFTLDDDSLFEATRGLHSAVVDATTPIEEAIAMSKAFLFWDPSVYPSIHGDTRFPRAVTVKRQDGTAHEGRSRLYVNTWDFADGSRVTDFRTISDTQVTSA